MTLIIEDIETGSGKTAEKARKSPCITAAT